MDAHAAPQELTVLTKCSCKGGCGSNRCSCYRAVLECTDACKCSGCKNRAGAGQQDLQGDRDIEENMQPDLDENVTGDEPSSDVEEDDDINSPR